MMNIHFVDFSKALGRKEIGKRPVVCVGFDGNRAKVYKITSRNRCDDYHIRMNNYLIHGYCDLSKYYYVDKKFLSSSIRRCTTSEVDSIEINSKLLKQQKRGNVLCLTR